MLKKISLLLLVLVAMTLTACDSKGTTEATIGYPQKYGIVDVVAGEETKTGVVLTLETDGFGGTVKVEVTIVGGKITDFDVLEHTESSGWGKAVIDNGTLAQALIDETDDLDSLDVHEYLDSEASATVTAEALLDIAKAALEHYADSYE